MSALEDYDKRCHREPLTPESITECVLAAERHLEHADVTYRVEYERVLCWLSDRLTAIYAVLQNPGIPVASRCAWCFRASSRTDEAWNALPKMTMDDAAAHSQACDHSPLVRKIRELEAQIEETRQDAMERDL